MLYNFAKAVVWLFFHIFYKVEVIGLENIPEDGALICPNHYAILDPLLVAISTPRKIRFMAKYEVFKIPLLNWFLRNVGTYPVKRGEPDLTSIKTTLKVLKEKELVGLFPEGTRIRTGVLGVANPGVALFSIRSGKCVVPVAITGNYRVFTRVKLNFGQPIDFSQYKKEKMCNEDYYELSQIVMKHIEQLKEDKK
jgi:1-acyl-sn-glycerol-3-phosphate acyltransferase